jgi:tetratricopeptide (TPR) repeat protein
VRPRALLLSTLLSSILLAASSGLAADGAAPDIREGSYSFWDRVRVPRSSVAKERLRAAVRSRMPRDIPTDELPAFDALLALRAATMLELVGGGASNDPEVLFFLGDSLVVADRGREEEGRRILSRALELEPEGASAARAWFTVALASNRLMDFARERAAYDQALRLEWDRNKRAQITANRGEACMSLGDLAAARKDYLAALDSTSDSQTHALASWGLAVAYARDDDLPDALRYAWEASRVRFADAQGNPVSALELPHVYFNPAHDVHYYRALGAMAAAEQSDDARVRKMELEWAVSQWHRYLNGARERGDRWIANATYQLRWCERRLEAMARNQRPARSPSRTKPR